MAKKREIKFTIGGFVYQEQKYDVRKRTLRNVGREQTVQQWRESRRPRAANVFEQI